MRAYKYIDTETGEIYTESDMTREYIERKIAGDIDPDICGNTYREWLNVCMSIHGCIMEIDEYNSLFGND